MITERANTGIDANPSIGDTVKILDEMDRLLNEMEDTMHVIKQLLGEESKYNLFSPGVDAGSHQDIESVIQGS